MIKFYRPKFTASVLEKKDIELVVERFSSIPEG